MSRLEYLQCLIGLSAIGSQPGLSCFGVCQMSRILLGRGSFLKATQEVIVMNCGGDLSLGQENYSQRLVT